MKDIVLWESKTARERETQHAQRLAAIHSVTTTPPELAQPSPRRLRWKKSLKVAAWCELFVLTAILIATVVLLVKAVPLARWVHEMRRDDIRHWSKRERETTDPEQRTKYERQRREMESRWWVAPGIVMSALLPLAGYCVNLIVHWFTHVRPFLVLLREGTAARGTVTASKRRLLLFPSVEFVFTTERGEQIRRMRTLHKSESGIFTVGSSVWVVYLPSRPKGAQIYGLKSALAEIEVRRGETNLRAP